MNVMSHASSADEIMQTGGDIRLKLDPATELNGYGSSHRPRPWAVTFASSTASSVSERGYAAADAARLRVLQAQSHRGDEAPVIRELAELRAAIGRYYHLSKGTKIILAASGTDAELAALAMTHLRTPSRPILNILLAPEETGSGVPMAARGFHFAIDTANGHDVKRETPIAGFRTDTAIATVALRDEHGNARSHHDIEADCHATIQAGIAAGRHVILHGLDLSKTGLLAPRLDILQNLRSAFGSTQLDIVIDACQVRLCTKRVRDYLALDAMVQITGSKFFTGPPFAGAVLLPPAIAARLGQGALPAGLGAYFSTGEWPQSARAASVLPVGGNFGLLLRWHAALAEMHAFAAIKPKRRAKILDLFAATVTQAMSDPAFELLPIPALARPGPDDWDHRRSIFAFSVRHPDDSRFMTVDEARKIYRWLNADCAAYVADDDKKFASVICHIGQPVKWRGADGAERGLLRVSAGARLISGEPSHHDLDQARRLARELADLRSVFAKILLLRRYWSPLSAADPLPHYRQSAASV
jgi:hypothetical protein